MTSAVLRRKVIINCRSGGGGLVEVHMGNIRESARLREHNKEVTLPVQTILPTTATQEKEKSVPRLKIQHIKQTSPNRAQDMAIPGYRASEPSRRKPHVLKKDQLHTKTWLLRQM